MLADSLKLEGGTFNLTGAETVLGVKIPVSTLPDPLEAEEGTIYVLTQQDGPYARGFYFSTGTAWEQSTGPQGPAGSPGADGQSFVIAKTYSSVAALTADVNPTGIDPGQFAMISTGSADNEDEGKIYLWRLPVNGGWQFIADLSGVPGIQGPAGPAGPEPYNGAQWDPAADPTKFTLAFNNTRMQQLTTSGHGGLAVKNTLVPNMKGYLEFRVISGNAMFIPGAPTEDLTSKFTNGAGSYTILNSAYVNAGDYLGMAIDGVNNTIAYYLNGVYRGTENFSVVLGAKIAAGSRASNPVIEVSTEPLYPAPAGFKVWGSLSGAKGEPGESAIDGPYFDPRTTVNNPAKFSLSLSNTRMTQLDIAHRGCRLANLCTPNAKVYVEFRVISNSAMFIPAPANTTDQDLAQYFAQGAGSYNYGGYTAANNTLGMAIDGVNNTITYYRNGVESGVQSITITQDMFICCGSAASNPVIDVRKVPQYPAPAGFRGLGSMIGETGPSGTSTAGDGIDIDAGVVSLKDGAYPYDVTGAHLGKPAASASVMMFYAPRSFVAPQNLPNSFAKAKTAATSSTVFAIKKNATQVGTITFAAGGNTGTFAFASAQTWERGDLLEVVAPATQDATLADISITIEAALNLAVL